MPFGNRRIPRVLPRRVLRRRFGALVSDVGALNGPDVGVYVVPGMSGMLKPGANGFDVTFFLCFPKRRPLG
jgi:hypothetical protein